MEFSEDFKKLFEGMVQFDQEDRFEIEDIKNSEWYKGKVYEDGDHDEYVEDLKQMI